MMCTINSLCLDSLPKFLDHVMSFKDVYGKDFPTFTLNILRFPSFQSPLVLPRPILQSYRDDLQYWLVLNEKQLHEMERNHIIRLLDYLNVVEKPHSDTFEPEALKNDFYHFYKQYDTRRGKNFTDTFPNLKLWYEALPHD